MPLPTSYSLKRSLRIWDSRLTRRREVIHFRGHEFPFLCTRWWNNVSQEIFDAEIAPYFDALGDFQPQVILDVGAATGHFSIVAARLFPGVKIHAFEPDERQRILFTRNAALNGIQHGQIQIEPFGLWKCSDILAFRTNGAESSFAPVSRFRGRLEFPEMLPVRALDEWIREQALVCIDLIKADAEGAEIEILKRATTTLQQFHPRLLLQAYHSREGARTFERCAEMLKHHSYTIDEYAPPSGLLRAI